MGERPSATALIVHPNAAAGRAERVLLQTVRALRDDGWRIVAALPSRGTLADLLIAEDVLIETVETPVLRKRDLGVGGAVRFVRDSLFASRRIRATLRRTAPDVVVVSTMTQPGWTLAARLHRIPVLVHVQELDTSAPSAVRGAIARPLTAADRVVVDTEAVRKSLLEVVPSLAARLTVLPTGMDGPESVTPPRERLVDGLRVCCVSRIEPDAGLGTVLDAFELLLLEGIAVRMEIVAVATDPGALRRLEARLERLELTELVTIRPAGRDLWEPLADADAVVVPSRAETSFGGTAVEVLLAGRPLVVTTTKGMSETADGFASAIPVDDGDPIALASALQRIVASWSAFRRAAITLAPIAAQRFSTATYRSEIAAEVRALVADRPHIRRLLAA